MPETRRILLDYKDIVTWAVKEKGIQSGIWGIYARFGLTVANTQVDFEGQTQVRPTVINSLLEIGLQTYPEINDLSVDAAIVNPAPKRASKGTAKGTIKKAAKKR